MLLAYGPVVVCGTYLVQAGQVTATLIHLSMILGLLVAAFLWINQFPDYLADKSADKRNLVVRMGREKAALTYVVIIAAAYLWLSLVAYFYLESRGAVWGLSGLPFAIFSAWRLLDSPENTPRIISAQAACLGSFVLMAIGSGIGYWLTTPLPAH